MSDLVPALEVEEVHRFLAAHGFVSLTDWLELDEDVAPHVIAQALDDRRRWAQAQQSNPRHRAQALWIIKNHRSLCAVMVDTPELHKQLRDALRRHRHDVLITQVGAALAVDPESTDAALLQGLRERLSRSKAPAPQFEVAPGLAAVVEEAVLNGTLPAGTIHDMVVAWRAQGMADEHIALLMLDELSRSGRNLAQ